MRAGLIAVIALAGCNQLLGVSDPYLQDAGLGSSPGGGGGDDAPIRGPGDAAIPGDGAPCVVPSPFSYPVSNISPCDLPAGTFDLMISGTPTIDTDAGTLGDEDDSTPLPGMAKLAQADGGPQVLVVSVRSLKVTAGAKLTVSGRRGLVIVAATDVQIDGQILANAVTSFANFTSPPGARSAAQCGGSAGGAGAGNSTTSGGSGGGGFGSAGGAGGSSQSSNAGGSGGAADGNVMLRPLLGGCPSASTEADGVFGPTAGGAIQISAGGQIGITNVISVSGGGGRSLTADDEPAAGGGSGGGLLLEAPTVSLGLAAALTANGGGGADASDTIPACWGSDGSTNTAVVAVGGQCSGGQDTSGGAGAAGSTPAHGGDAGTRGTGGGGGAGRIAIHAHTFTPSSQAIMSPAPHVETF
jgi:hypothetical protein